MKNMLRNVIALFFIYIMCISFSPAVFAEGVSINVSNFPDANFRSYVSETIDWDSDNYLSSNEIEAVNVIDCEEMNITDLAGLEYFTNLQYLYCRFNQLITLDTSNNPALTELDCCCNQLATLNVNNNTALTELYCYENQLTNLDVSSSPELIKLECDKNQLTSLDVSNNTALKLLRCGWNQLTNLDVGENSVLTRLYCFENQLTDLNISSCSSLKYLRCDSNQLKSLDISGCPLLICAAFYSPHYSQSYRYENGSVHDAALYGGTEVNWGTTDPYIIIDKATPLIAPFPDLILPSSLKSISEKAFAGGAFLHVKFPEQTQSIGPFAFADCPNLRYIYIPNPVTAIDGNAFGDIQKLVVYGKAGSTAEDFAYEHDFDFIPII